MAGGEVYLGVLPVWLRVMRSDMAGVYALSTICVARDRGAREAVGKEGAHNGVVGRLTTLKEERCSAMTSCVKGAGFEKVVYHSDLRL